MYKIKDRLKEALDIRGMLPVDLARKSGINKGTISRYLKGEIIPKQSKIFELARALNVSPAWLFGYDVPMEGSSEDMTANVEIDTTRLTKSNLDRLLAYYQALIDSQGGEHNGDT